MARETLGGSALDEVEVEGDGNTYTATVEGRTFQIEVPEAKAAGPKKRGGGGGRKRSGIVSASMPGKVVTVEVAVGDEVAEGQTVLILEAMKMQNEVASQHGGVVEDVLVAAGDRVDAGQALLKLAPPQRD